MHLLSFAILIGQMRRIKSCIGVSSRSQEAYLLVFLARYSDLLIVGIRSHYLFAMKVLFMALTLWTIWLIRFSHPIKMTYDSIHDNFPHRVTLYPLALIIALVYHVHFSKHPYYSLVWSWSIVLESIALLPQLYMLRKTNEVDTFSTRYILCLALYRFCYLVNWVIRLTFRDESLNAAELHFEVIFGIVQSLFVSDFVYRYFKSLNGKTRITIPI